MNLLALRYFIEVAETLNFSQAARNLHISQPGLSQQIGSLEENLGMKLLHRTTRKVTLTDEGKYLYKHLASSFETIESTITEMKKSGTIPQTSIKIATIPSAASNWIPRWFKDIKKKFNDIEFYIQETSSSEAIELVRERQCDIAFIRTPLNVRDLVADQLNFMELKRYPIRLVVPSDHPVANKETIDLSEVKEETFLHYDKEKAPSLHYMLENACLNAGFIPKILVTGPELLTIANLISNGIGVTLMPEDMIQLLPTENIKVVDIKNHKAYNSVSVIWNERKNVSMITQYALDVLEGYGKEEDLQNR